MTDPVTYSHDGEIAIITINNPPVNALGHAVRLGLIEAIDRFDGDGAASAAVVIGAGRHFSGGADIREFGKARLEPHLTDVTLRFDAATKPIVAAINGTAFGGGLELALSCHFRICDPSALLCLPEVKIGIIPGASGTQRLPRLIGLKKALAMIVTGDPVDGSKAVDLGIADKIAEGELLPQALGFAREIVGDQRALKRSCDPLEGPGIDDQARAALDEARQLAAKRMAGQIAPLRAIDSVENGLTTTFVDALAADREIFGELVSGEQSKALRYAFFAERQAAKVPGIDRDTPVRPINAAGVIGAGTMGSGIAIALADAGIAVNMIDASDEALERGRNSIAKIYDSMARRGRITAEERDRRIGLITTSTSYDGLGQVDLVIEAIFEDLELKKEIFAKLDRICRPGAILATNSSSLDINLIAAATSRPKDVCGLHFFSPANIMKLLEIVRTDDSADDVIATAMALAKRIGKVGVLAGICSGYVANRSRQPLVQEAVFLVEDGATPQQVDRVLVEFGMLMGPLAVADLAGTDISYMVRKSQKSAWNPKARYPFLADQIAEMGRHGRKAGKGWYRYGEDRRTPLPDPEFDVIAAKFRKQHGITARQFSDEEILERCLFAAINEGTHILAEGKALRASDIDVMWLTGFAFPRYRGGIMYYGDQIGLKKVYDRICAFREEMGEQWRTSDLLKELAQKQGSFADI